MEAVILEKRQQLTYAVKNGADTAMAIQGVLQINCPLDKKFKKLGGFGFLLENNSQSVDSLKKLLTMLNILEKYGRHLLKPAEQRSSMWRHIKNSNTIYRERVAGIWGGKLIMTLMGYTEDRGDGVAFPEGKEPDSDAILELVADIVLGKKEVEAYLGGNHPNPNYIEEHLNKEFLATLKQRTSDEGVKASTRIVPSSLSGIKPGTVPQLLGINSSQLAGTIPSQLPKQNTEKSEEVQSNDMEGQNENRASSIVCDICGKNQADIVCRVCDNKQLCGDCDTKWHSHPKRQNHQRQKLSSDKTLTETPPQPCGAGAVTSNQNQPRIALGGLQGREPENVYRPQANTLQTIPSSSSHEQIYQPLIKPGTGGSMIYEPLMYHVPSSVPQSQFMYQAQYPPQNLHNQPRMLPGMWPGNQPGSGQYYTPSHMLGVSAMPGVSHMAGGSHMTGVNPMQGGNHMVGTNQVPGTNAGQAGAQQRVGQSMQYPFANNQEVRGSFPGYNPDFPQSHTLAYFPASYTRVSTPNTATSDRLAIHQYSSPSPSPHNNSDFSFPGNQFRPVSPVIYQEPQSASDDSYNTPSKSENTIKRSASHLVLKLKAIPNLEKRRARLDIDLATLKGDIEEWDAEINQIIVDKDDFFQDKNYQELNNKKKKHLREIKELVKYEEELDKIIAEKALDQKNQELTELRQRSNQGVFRGLDRQGMNIRDVSNPPDVNRPTSLTEHATQPGNLQEKSDRQYIPAEYSANEENDNIKNDEEERKLRMDDIRKMFVLNQNPFNKPEPKQDLKQMNIPVDDSNPNTKPPSFMASEGVSYPPSLMYSGDLDPQTLTGLNQTSGSGDTSVKPKSIPAQPKGSETYVVVKGKEKQPVINAPPEFNLQPVKYDPIAKDHNLTKTDQQRWECEHCTFVNEHNSNVCTMCCRTNDKRKIIAIDVGANEPGIEGDENGVEPCKTCTFHNDKNADKCQMCGNSLVVGAGAQKQDPLVAPSVSSPDQQMKGAGAQKLDLLVAPSVSSPGQQMKGAVSPRATSLEQKLEEEQDQVMKEKKEAHRRYRESLEAEERNRNNEAAFSPGIDESTFVFVEGAEAVPLTAKSTNLGSGDVGTRKPANKNIAFIQQPKQQTSLSSPDSFHTAPTSLENSPKQMPLQLEEHHVIDRRPPASVNFNDAIEHIQMRRAQEQMSIDGRDFVMLVKAAEQDGFGLDEIEISVQHCIDDKMSPHDWLKKKWGELVELVADMVSQNGKLPGNDIIGELSRKEAKEELVWCRGNVEEAVNACIKKRKKKFKEIKGDGNYSKEKILTALYQNEGNVEATIDQLNSYIIKGFNEHMWIEPEPEGPRTEGPQSPLEGAVGGVPAAMAGVGAVRGHGMEENDGAMDSVINKADFQQMIKNKDVDKERRIRMVFVEGKLQSWGRAETVIIILDTEAEQLEDVVDCTLDDLVEAVKNCGDRKRSLAYLKQECGICFSYYPMNKIQNLNSCQCKLCRGCLKQNFEVAIREKYVRHWVCPLCQAPNLEDEAAASSYFEFLQLLLRELVDQEIKDLFETKLRDWHLQKELNFRWCAHCASGFVWDRPNILGMECPHCKMRTCFLCKKKWEDQHQGLTCEEFTQWKIDNDPNMQAIGLARHLEENGIDCPSCKMRYDLAKGGCMHFRCPQCGHEFCSGCSEPFMQDGTCRLLKECKGKGLHCHHPRDCFYYLRDNDTVDLQALLKQNKVIFNVEIPTSQRDPRHCPVMEQKEYGSDKKDEACGKDSQKGMAGLCESHYKEYLVGLINKNKVDPVDIMGVQELERCFARRGKQAPKPRNESEGQYRKRLAQFCKENLPLRR